MEQVELEKVGSELKMLGEELLKSLDFGDLEYAVMTEGGMSVSANYQKGTLDAIDGDNINSVFEL